MSYNNRAIDSQKAFTTGSEGILLDFDKSELGYLMTDSVFKMDIDFKKMQLKNKSNTLKNDFRLFEKDSIEIELSENRVSVFRPLNLNHKLDIQKNKIIDFLTNNCFEKINEYLKIEFTNDLYPFEKRQNIRKLNSTFHNRRQSIGYWGIKEIEGNYFLFFNSESINDQHIYQIITLEENKINLKPIQETEFNLTELKTCL